MHKVVIKTIMFLMLGSSAICAQSSYVAGLFPTIDHSATISNRLDYSVYYFAAFPLVSLQKPDISKNAYFNLLYFEQALTYKFSNKLSLTGSYVYQRANVVYKDYSNENRFYLQAKYKHSIKKVNLSYRLRFDGRFIHNPYTDQTPFTHRVRGLIGIEALINDQLYLTAYEEAFFNTFRNASAIYGENWAYAALGKKVNANNKVEIGILYVTWNTAPKSWYNQYYLQLTWINHLDLRKNKA